MGLNQSAVEREVANDTWYHQRNPAGAKKLDAFGLTKHFNLLTYGRAARPTLEDLADKKAFGSKHPKVVRSFNDADDAKEDTQFVVNALMLAKDVKDAIANDRKNAIGFRAYYTDGHYESTDVNVIASHIYRCLRAAVSMTAIKEAIPPNTIWDQASTTVRSAIGDQASGVKICECSDVYLSNDNAILYVTYFKLDLKHRLKDGIHEVTYCIQAMSERYLSFYELCEARDRAIALNLLKAPKKTILQIQEEAEANITAIKASHLESLCADDAFTTMAAV